MSAAASGPATVSGGIPLAPGRFNALSYSQARLMVAGWMFRPGHWLDSYRLKVNGKPVGDETAPTHQDGVLKKFESLPESGISGFVLRALVPEQTLRDWSEVEVCGRVKGQEVGRMSVLYRLDHDQGLPDTPVELRFRVTGSRNPIEQYRLQGLQTFGKFYGAMQKHLEAARVKRVLDWGCGCGRVTSVLLKYLPEAEVHGCDIDREAIEWSAGNLAGGRFAPILPYPPTGYADNMFDAVTGCSVLTHLRRELQFEWLKEMKRIIAPGGLLLASVHGDFAALHFNNPPAVKQEVQAGGISDRTQDRILDGIAPDNYYRGTFQSKIYTCREFARYFQVLDYIELGMGNLQDLVVMKKA